MSHDLETSSSYDPEVDLRSQRRDLVRRRGAVLAVIAIGGGIGATARLGLLQAWPPHAGHIPWATFVANVLGSMLIGVVMVVFIEVWPAHRLVRPFLGVGVLGGFTTFSTYAVDIVGLLETDAIGLAYLYLAATLVSALLAVIAGVWLARFATRSAARRG